MVPFNKSWYVQVLDFLQMIYVLELTQSITTDRDTSIVALISLGRATQDIVGFTDSRSAPRAHCMKEGVKPEFSFNSRTIIYRRCRSPFHTFCLPNRHQPFAQAGYSDGISSPLC